MSKAGLFELHAVVAVATRRSFRGAAAELGMSPSALSHAIAGAGAAPGRAPVQPHDAQRGAVASGHAVPRAPAPGAARDHRCDGGGQRVPRHAVGHAAHQCVGRRGAAHLRTGGAGIRAALSRHAGRDRHRRADDRHRGRRLRCRHPAEGRGAARHDRGAVQPADALCGGGLAGLFPQAGRGPWRPAI